MLVIILMHESKCVRVIAVLGPGDAVALRIRVRPGKSFPIKFWAQSARLLLIYPAHSNLQFLHIRSYKISFSLICFMLGSCTIAVRATPAWPAFGAYLLVTLAAMKSRCCKSCFGNGIGICGVDTMLNVFWTPMWFELSSIFLFSSFQGFWRVDVLDVCCYGKFAL